MNKLKSPFLALAMTMVLILACRGGEEETPGAWDIITVTTTGHVGEYCSIAIDGDGNAHIAAFDHTRDEPLGADSMPYGRLVYATNRTGLWETTTLYEGGGLTPRTVSYTHLTLPTN